MLKIKTFLLYVIFSLYSFTSTCLAWPKLLTYNSKKLGQTALVGNGFLLGVLAAEIALLYEKKPEISLLKHLNNIYRDAKKNPTEHKALLSTISLGVGFNGKVIFDVMTGKTKPAIITPAAVVSSLATVVTSNDKDSEVTSNDKDSEKDENSIFPNIVVPPAVVPLASVEKLQDNYFTHIFNFNEADYEQTRLELCAQAYYKKGDALQRVHFGAVGPNKDQSVQVGTFEVPTMQALQAQVLGYGKEKNKGTVTLTSVIGDSRKLHLDTNNNGSVIQVASQFNCLEMGSPNMVPENGIVCYQYDRTQGPACAIPCAAGTAWRNYCTQLLSVENPGQRAESQINNLADIENILKARTNGKSFWTVKNGYVESTDDQLVELNKLLQDQLLVNQLKQVLRIGVHWDTEVTEVIDWKNRKEPLLVTQTFNSALSIGYSRVQDKKLWAPLARLVLEASYEATLYTAVLNNKQRAEQGKAAAPVYLTAVGGGVFANDHEWIGTAIGKAIKKIESLGYDLDVRVTYYDTISQKLDNAIKDEIVR